MTVRMMKISKGNADQIISNQLRHLFRSSREYTRAGDIIEFIPYREGKPVAHSINGLRYVVTVVQGSELVPVKDGWQVIGFRKI